MNLQVFPYFRRILGMGVTNHGSRRGKEKQKAFENREMPRFWSRRDEVSDPIAISRLNQKKILPLGSLRLRGEPGFENSASPSKSSIKSTCSSEGSG